MNKNNNLSSLGIGIMRWPNKPDHRQSIDFIDCAIENGVNYFETCMFYNNYHCEQIVAALLKKYPRESYNLAGKMAVHGILEQSKNPDVLFNEQLKKCNTDHFDYYLIQAVDRNCLDIMRQTDLINFLRKKKEQGVIKNLGFSFHDDETTLEYMLLQYNWDCVQIQLNYFDWYYNNHKKLYDMLCDKNIPIFVMGALKGGQLSYNLPPEVKDFFTNEVPDLTPSQIAMSFVTNLPQVQMVLTGATKIDELKENINTCNNSCIINDTIFKKASEILAGKNLINCSKCGYCKPYCPHNISIPEIFSLYNKMITSYTDGDKQDYLKIQKNYKDGMNGCVKCRKCIPHCPQKLDIPKLILETGMYYR